MNLIPISIRFAFAVLLVSCCFVQGCASKAPRADDAAILTGQWTLVSFAGAASLPAGENPPTLIVAADGTLSGFSGVNRFSGQLDMADVRTGRFSCGPLACTRMAGSAAAMELEQRYLKLLADADGFKSEGRQLVLTRVGKELAFFRP